MLPLLPLSPRNLAAASLLVSRYEPFCAALAQEVRTGGADVFVLTDGDEAAGAIRAGHTLLHCIPRVTWEVQLALIDFLNDRMRREHPARCISGEASATAMLVEVLAALGQQPQEIRHYSLMASSLSPEPVILPPAGFSVYVPAPTAEAADALMPLQTAYIKEEVLPACRELSLPATRLGLEKSLRERRVICAADEGGTPAAKVSLNAVGFDWVQLGGVYTAPQWRRHGLAQCLVSRAVNDAARAGKRVALYVREENTAAIRLYRRAGFTALGKFEIVYY